MLAPHRPERGEAEIIGVGVLDRLAVVYLARTGEGGRRQEKGEDSQENVVASEAKQSRGGAPALDCFVAARLAMTAGIFVLAGPHRSVAPVFLLASATIFCATASISASVSVFSRGWSVTATPTDFLPSGTPTPS
ncbi:hypothetical protein MJC1_01656 [Methylocystis sp. MJC1]|nr:hypothetical protein MJC1_01656 [Methylocystis sp. MJC1]